MTGDPNHATTATSTLGIACAEPFAAKDYGSFVVEQQAYLAERDGRIGWMRVVCSGFRPV